MSFSHATYILFISTTPKVLTHATIDSKVQSLLSISSKSDMAETQGIIPPEVKFLSSCEPLKPNELCTSKTQWWEGPRTYIPIPKGRNRKEGWGDRSQASSKPIKSNEILGSRTLLSGFMFWLLDPLVWQHHSYSLAECCSCRLSVGGLPTPQLIALGGLSPLPLLGAVCPKTSVVVALISS